MRAGLTRVRFFSRRQYTPDTCGAASAPTGSPPNRWDAASTCAEGATQLAFNWVVPPGMAIELRHAVGHQHIGGTGISLFANGTLLCESVPQYATSGAEQGFVSKMSGCDFRGAPVRIAGGTPLRVVSSYHAAAAPLAHAAFQAPWVGTMGYMTLMYTLADDASAAHFGVITGDGRQAVPPPGRAGCRSRR